MNSNYNKQRVKVLQLIASLGAGGAEKVSAQLALNLDPLRYEVSVCCIKWEGVWVEKLRRHNIPVYLLSSVGRVGQYLSGFKLASLLRKTKPTILHSHDNTALFDAAFSSLLCHIPLRFHTFHFGNYPYYPKKYLYGERLAAKIPNHLVAVSNHQCKKLIQHQKIPPHRIRTILNGVEENPYLGNKQIIEAKKKELKIDENDIVLGTVAVLSKQKGITYLLDAAKMLANSISNVKFVIVGDGNLMTELMEKTKRLGLKQKVIFTGLRYDVQQLLVMFDVFVMSSLWEGLPLTLIEAMAAAKPAISTDAGDNSILVQKGVTGYLVPPRNPSKMAEAILRIAKDRTRQSAFGQAALRRFRGNFSVQRMTLEYSNLYEEYLGIRK